MMPGDGVGDPGGGKPPDIQTGNGMDIDTGTQNENTSVIPGKNTSSNKTSNTPSAEKQAVLYKSGMRCDTYKLIVQMKPNSAPAGNDGGKRTFRYIRSLILSRLLADITNKSPDILEIRRLNRSKFMVVCATSKCANEIVENEKMKEQFMAFIPANYVTRACIIRDVDVEITDDEIRENIDVGSFKIIHMQRLNRKTFVDGKVNYVPSSTVKFVFEGQDMPKFVYLWYSRLPCEPFIQNPIQCFSCFRYGHITKYCKSKKLCNKCFHEDDDEHECNLVELKCLNCGGKHNSNSKSCPEYERQRNIKLLMSTRSLCFPEANALIPRVQDSYTIRTKNSFAVLENIGNEDSSNVSSFNTDYPELKSNHPKNLRTYDRYVPPPLSVSNMTRPPKRKPETSEFNREKLTVQNKKNRNLTEAMSQITKPDTYYKGNEISKMIYKGCAENKIDKDNYENKKWLDIAHPDIQFSGYSFTTNSQASTPNVNINTPLITEDNNDNHTRTQHNQHSRTQHNSLDTDYHNYGSPHLGY